MTVDIENLVDTSADHYSVSMRELVCDSLPVPIIGDSVFNYIPANPTAMPFVVRQSCRVTVQSFIYVGNAQKALGLPAEVNFISFSDLNRLGRKYPKPVKPQPPPKTEDTISVDTTIGNMAGWKGHSTADFRDVKFSISDGEVLDLTGYWLQKDVSVKQGRLRVELVPRYGIELRGGPDAKQRGEKLNQKEDNPPIRLALGGKGVSSGEWGFVPRNSMGQYAMEYPNYESFHDLPAGIPVRMNIRISRVGGEVRMVIVANGQKVVLLFPVPPKYDFKHIRLQVFDCQATELVARVIRPLAPPPSGSTGVIID
jgi:hypothetical protein